jgi:hypothetical protein
MRDAAEGLRFLKAVAVTMSFVGRAGPEAAEAVEPWCEAPIRLEPATRTSWQMLGRIIRHVLGVLDDRQGPSAVLLPALHAEVLHEIDATAATPQTGG